MLFHGPDVAQGQGLIYARLGKLGATCYAWGTKSKKAYPGLVDLQHRHSLLANPTSNKTVGLSGILSMHEELATATRESFSLPAQQSIGRSRESLFLGPTLPLTLVKNTVREITLSEQIRHTFAPKAGYTTVIRCGQSDYRLPPLHAAHWPAHVTDVTWCRSPQVLTYSQLSEIISRSRGEEMTIVDLGAGDSLGSYSRNGSSCVAHALAFGAIEHLASSRPHDLFADPERHGGLFARVGIHLKAIMAKVKDRGASLDHLTAMCNRRGTARTLSIALWTPSTPDGRLDSGNTQFDNADVNLVI